MLKVVEIFYSIQGEGHFSGVPCVFIRLYGCNLACSFCDDSLHKGNYKSYSFEEIIDEIDKYPSKQVIITGGEPTLYDLNDFIEFLHKSDYFVAIETNGYKLEHVKNADWITYSPKNWESIEETGWSEIKFIVSKDSDIKRVVNFKTAKEIFIQPLNFFDRPDMQNLNFCIELVKKYPHLKLSIQMHKFLGVK